MVLGGTVQKFTIVEAIVEAGKETIEIGEKILEQGDFVNLYHNYWVFSARGAW